MSAILLRKSRYHWKEKRGNKASVLSSFPRPFSRLKDYFFDDIGELSPSEGNMEEKSFSSDDLSWDYV